MRKQLTGKKHRSKSVSVCAALIITAIALSGCGTPDIEVEERSPILEDADIESREGDFIAEHVVISNFI